MCDDCSSRYVSGCSTMLILLGYGRGGRARCLAGSVIRAVQQNRILVVRGLEALRVLCFLL